MSAPKPRRALLALNRAARNGGQDLEAARAQLRAAGFELADVACRRASDLSPSILARRHAVDCVIVAGGDGTVNAALAGVTATGMPLGVLPLGTANDFARSVGIPTEIEAAARVIAEACTHTIDLGDVNGHPFLNVASVGLAADLAKRLTPERKRRFGRLSYAMTAAHLLARARPFHATLLLGDERVMVKTLQIAIGNGRYYGGGNVIAGDAQIDNGHLDLYSLEFAQVWRVALMIRAFKSGAHGALREVRTARGADFEVVTRKPRPVNADGELLTYTPARFTQKLRALTVFVPQSCTLRTAASAAAT